MKKLFFLLFACYSSTGLLAQTTPKESITEEFNVGLNNELRFTTHDPVKSYPMKIWSVYMGDLFKGGFSTDLYLSQGFKYNFMNAQGWQYGIDLKNNIRVTDNTHASSFSNYISPTIELNGSYMFNAFTKTRHRLHSFNLTPLSVNTPLYHIRRDVGFTGALVGINRVVDGEYYSDSQGSNPSAITAVNTIKLKLGFSGRKTMRIDEEYVTRDKAFKNTIISTWSVCGQFLIHHSMMDADGALPSNGIYMRHTPFMEPTEIRALNISPIIGLEVDHHIQAIVQTNAGNRFGFETRYYFGLDPVNYSAAELVFGYIGFELAFPVRIKL